MRKTLEELEKDFIKVTETYLIQVNELDYAVRKKGDKNYFRYFGKLENALDFIRKEVIRNGLGEAQELTKAIEVIESSNKRAENFIKETLKQIGFSDEKYLTR